MGAAAVSSGLPLPGPARGGLPSWRVRALAPGSGASSDLLELLRRRAGPGEELFFLTRPSGGFGAGGVGTAVEIRVAGPRRFACAARSAADLLRGLARAASGPAEAGVLARAALVASFSFDPEGPGRLVVPRELWISEGSGVRGVGISAGRAARRFGAGADIRAGMASAGPAAGPYAVESDPPPHRYRELVERALAAIGAGALEKVVVARSVTVRALGGRPFEPLGLAGELRERHPTCAVFCWRLADGTSFVGATPELLLRRRGDWIESEALAGTAAAGADARSAERGLLGSAKERAEHRSVVEAIARRLRPHCDVLEVPGAPRPRRHGDVIHLHTPIRGRLREGAPGLLGLLGVLHPTPAVAGAPAPAALAFLRRHEGLDRGLYGGVVGLLGSTGEGEFSVALRCAHIEGARARLFAGAGVVAGSSPERELAETRLKLGAVLPALLEL